MSLESLYVYFSKTYLKKKHQYLNDHNKESIIDKVNAHSLCAESPRYTHRSSR